MTSHRSLDARFVLLLCLSAALATAAASGVLGQSAAVEATNLAPTPAPSSGGVLEGALVAAPSLAPAPALADLIAPDGTPFDLGAMAGRPTLLFFGYTHCPDICPLTIGEILGVFEAEATTQALFVSIDPERDTPEFLTTWSAYLPGAFHALTGTLGAVRRAADAYGVRYARVETGSSSGYTFSHSADVYLIDGQGRLVGTFPFGTPAAQMAADIAALTRGLS